MVNKEQKEIEEKILKLQQIIDIHNLEIQCLQIELQQLKNKDKNND